MKYDVAPTVEKIREMAATMRKYAGEIESHADSMARTGDLAYASEVINTFVNMTINARLDLMVSRPLRETMKETK